MQESPWTRTSLEILGPSDFDGQVLKRPGPYIVEFGASWCPWTRRFTRTFEEWNGRLHGTLAIADITELSSPLWETFEVRITPSIVCFVDGVQVHRVDGRRMLGIRKSELRSIEDIMAKRVGQTV